MPLVSDRIRGERHRDYTGYSGDDYAPIPPWRDWPVPATTGTNSQTSRMGKKKPHTGARPTLCNNALGTAKLVHNKATR